MRYKNVMFDLYGTLIDIRTNEDIPMLWYNLAALYERNGAKYLPMELREMYQKYEKAERKRVKELHPELSYIDIDIAIVFDQLYKDKGVDAGAKLIEYTAKQFRKISTYFLRLYPGVEELLIYLRATGRKVILMSNAQSLFTMQELDGLGLTKYLDKIYISSDVGISKPDPEFFNHAVSELGLDKSETIMVGNDYIADMGGAYAAGLTGLYIDQEISSKIEGDFDAVEKIMDGDVYKAIEFFKKNG